jgi:hypothetical protein
MRNGEKVLFRRVDTPIDSTSFRNKLYLSRDDGASWILLNEQTNHAVAP